MEGTSTILVAYATWGGSARAVAEAVRDALAADGVVAEARPAGEVDDLSAYSGVILGTPLQAGRLHGDIHSFVTRHRAALSDRPLALFVVCLTRKADTPENRSRAEASLAELWQDHPHTRPVAIGLFCDAPRPDEVALQRLPFSRRIRYKRMKPAGAKYADWDDLQSWVAEARGRLVSATAPA